MIKYFVFLSIILSFTVSCCTQIPKEQKKNIKKTDSEISAVEHLPKYEWTDDQPSDYKVKELALIEGVSRSFEVLYKNNIYVLLFEKQGNKSLLTISSNHKQLFKGEIERLATLHVGVVSIEGKQELWIETAENRPVYYKVELSPALCTVTALSFDSTHY